MLLRQKDIKAKYRISRFSLLDWEARGLINVYRTPGNHKRYLESEIQSVLQLNKIESKQVAIYARVSTKKQEENLQRQCERLRAYCVEKGYGNPLEFVEIGSGLNDNRRELQKLLKKVMKQEIKIVVVEYRDRLARFGVKTIEELFKGFDCKVEVLKNQADQNANEELTQDLLSVIASFSGRLYGVRGGRQKLRKDLDL